MKHICLVDVVGLTPELISSRTPVLQELAGGETSQDSHALEGVFPAVTLPPQASVLTGTPPSQHGIVGNGWLYDTQEIRFWQQSRQLVSGETIYEAARSEFGESFTSALVFSWFSQGARCADYRVIPKPWYGSDGRKEFDIHGAPSTYVDDLKQELGEFPFFTFWGPNSGPPATEWIAQATAHTLESRRPNLTFSYLPLLDYPLQKYGPDSAEAEEALSNVDDCVGTIKEAAERTDTKLVIFSEYGLSPVEQPVHINRLFRKQGWLKVRTGPFGEKLDVGQSSVFAAADHQIAHVYVRDDELMPEVQDLLEQSSGVDQVLGREGKHEFQIDHPRSGDLIAIADPDAWFTYYFWLDDNRAPDYARTVDIHRKPGYDPVEMFVDPEITIPKLKAGWTVLKKKLGFRYRMDLTPLDATLVQGSHGRPPSTTESGPVFLSPDLEPPEPQGMTQIKPWLMNQFRSS